jgi:hypothetical protein
LDGALAQGEDFLAKFDDAALLVGVFILEGFDETGEGLDFCPTAFDVGEDGAEFEELFFGHNGMEWWSFGVVE